MKLDKLCTLFTDGDWIESKDQSDSGIRLIQTGNIGNGEFLYKNDKAKYISVDTFKRLNCKEVFPNDILVSRLPEPVGRGCIIPDIGEKMIAAVDCTICRINEDLVDRKYFCYFLESNAYKTQLEQHVTGTTRKRISRKNLSSVEIDIPEQAKQKEVVYKLDRLKKIIQNYNRELDLLDELVRARFVEMFGDPEDNPFKWDKMPLSNIMLNANNGVARRGNDENGKIVLRLVELQDGYINYSNPNRICLNENEKKRYLLKNNDFLFARVNGNPDNVGRCAVFHDIGEDVYHNDHIIRVHFNEELLNGVFASELINSNFGKRQLKKRIKTSAGQYTVSQDGIGAIVSIVPPLELQNQFASFVQEIDKSRSRIQKSLEASQELFDSLMQEYFG